MDSLYPIEYHDTTLADGAPSNYVRIETPSPSGQDQGSDGGHRPMAAATGAVEITLPVAIVAAAYIVGQAIVDTWGD